jgi:GRAM domain
MTDQSNLTTESLREVTLIDVAANLFRGAEAVGGRMQITTHHILFKAHAINIQKEPAEIDLKDIVEVGKRNTLGLVPNGMYVRTKDGTEYRFVVWGRGNLIKIIQSASKDRIEGKI